MAVRPADPDREEDLDLVLTRLRESVNAPNEDKESIRRKLDSERFFFVHPEEGTVCWLREYTATDPWECHIIYWLWGGVGNRRKMAGVLREALEAFVAAHPTSAAWDIWGDLPTRKEAEDFKALFGVLGATVTVRRSPRNPDHLTEARSSVGAILQALRKLP